MGGCQAWMTATSDRVQAIKDVYEQSGINLVNNDVQYSSWSFREACNLVIDKLKEDPSYDIIYCASDYVALGVYHALSHLNMKVGKDIAVVGYDNQVLSRELSPKLTSVELPYEAMSRLAIEYAYALTKGKQAKKEKIRTLQGELFIRASSPKARSLSDRQQGL